MPTKPLRPCAQPGCPNLVREGRFCPDHQHKQAEQRRELHRQYDEHQRDPKLAEFYASPEWRSVRQRTLARDKYLCQDCLRRGRVTPADTVHHIVEVSKDWSKRLQLSNLVSLCAGCHNQRHKRDRGERAGRRE